MRLLGASIAFLTRVPVPGAAGYGAEDVGRSSRWFPFIGMLLGAVYVLLFRLLSFRLPPDVIATLIVIAEAFLTGALHMDALADMADGFGGGHSREDVLRIMRDHAIGSYGAAALILLIALKIGTIGALIQRQHALPYLLLAPALGRWSIVPLSRFLPYARDSKSSARYVGNTELVWATVVAAAVTAAAAVFAAPWHVGVCWFAVAAGTAWFGRYSLRKIGGVTGDTLGANVQISECIVLLAGLALS